MNLLDRLQALAGMEEAASDISLAHGRKAQHAAWLLSPLQHEGMQDLEPEEQHALWLLELWEASGLEFQQDDQGPYALLAPQPGLPVALLHLRPAEPWLLYAWGDAKETQRLGQLLQQAPAVHLHRLGHDLLLKTAQSWFEITQIAYAFASQDHELQGQARGKEAKDLMNFLSQQLPTQFCLESIGGKPKEMGMGLLLLQEAGGIQAQDLRLSEFLKALEPVTQALEIRRQRLLDQHLLRWERGNLGLAPGGRPLEFQLGERLTQPELLLKQLTKGGKPWDLLGNYQRYSSQLWRAMLVDEQGRSLTLELEGQSLRLLLEDRGSLALLERVEQLLSRQWGLQEVE